MSINRDMKPYMLQRNEPVRSPSGAPKDNWINVRQIDAAVYKKNDMKVSASEVYLESTHSGVTRYKGIESGCYRLVRDGVIYQVTGFNPEGRLGNLLLKVVK